MRQGRQQSNSVEAIYSALREAIISGEVEPGNLLHEEALAEQFHVSRTPIREVLVRLEAEQFVERVPRRGMVVRGMDSMELEEVFMIRMAVDGLAARFAASKRTPVDVAKLRWINSQMRSAAKSGDISAVAELNMSFHEALCEIAANRMLMMFMGQVHSWVRRSPTNPFAYPNRGLDGADEHDDIIDAIEAGDAKRAQSLIQAHMETSRKVRAALVAAGRSGAKAKPRKSSPSARQRTVQFTSTKA